MKTAQDYLSEAKNLQAITDDERRKGLKPNRETTARALAIGRKQAKALARA